MDNGKLQLNLSDISISSVVLDREPVLIIALHQVDVEVMAALLMRTNAMFGPELTSI